MNEIVRHSRRLLALAAFAGAALAGLSPLAPLQASTDSGPFREISWDDLIPPGVPYSEIIEEGELDEQADTWKPVFDENATKLNEELDGESVKLPGYIIPLDVDSDGVSGFVLVPYVGACIHVPPPPPNQLVFVTTDEPWPSDHLWEPVWVYGPLSAALQSTAIAETGYRIAAERIEVYEWPKRN